VIFKQDIVGNVCNFNYLKKNSLHPYTVLFAKKRRARYYKVERALRGFYVPEWIRKEAEER